MTQLMADENFQTDQGASKRPHDSIIFTLNLVKLTLQIGNQPGSSFVTMSQINLGEWAIAAHGMYKSNQV